MFHKCAALALATSLLLGSSIPSAAVKVRQKEDAIFGIFEVVDCATAGARSMASQLEEKRSYCIPPKPLVSRIHLKSVKSSWNSAFDQPQLLVTLTDEGARIMQRATERLLHSRTSDAPYPTLAIIVQGKLVSAPTLRDVIKDKLVVAGLTQKQVDDIAAALGGEKEEPRKDRGSKPAEPSVKN